MVATHFNFDFYKETIDNIGASAGIEHQILRMGIYVVWISYHKKEAGSTHVCETINQFTTFHADKKNIPKDSYFPFTKTCSLEKKMFKKNPVEI
jgi:hypothetical protein